MGNNRKFIGLLCIISLENEFVHVSSVLHSEIQLVLLQYGKQLMNNFESYKHVHLQNRVIACLLFYVQITGHPFIMVRGPVILTPIAERLAVKLSLPVFTTQVCRGWDSNIITSIVTPAFQSVKKEALFSNKFF